MRYNCADSLDRTNVASFFGAIQVFIEQCRELDIAIAHAPKGVNGVAEMILRQPSAGLSVRMPSTNGRDGGSLSRPSTPFGGGQGGGGSGGMGAIEKLGKELNKGLLTLMNDLKTPRGGGGASSTPGIPPRERRMSAGGDLARGSVPIGVGSRGMNSVSTSAASVPSGAAHSAAARGGGAADLEAMIAQLEATGPLPPMSP